jgi:hypothetical protein
LALPYATQRRHRMTRFLDAAMLATIVAGSAFLVLLMTT